MVAREEVEAQLRQAQKQIALHAAQNMRRASSRTDPAQQIMDMQQQHDEQLLMLQAAVDSNARVTALQERMQQNAIAALKQKARRSDERRAKAEFKVQTEKLERLAAEAVVRKVEKENAAKERTLQQLRTPRAEWKGRPPAQAAAIHAAIVGQGANTPQYWRAQMDAKNNLIVQLRAAAEESQKKSTLQLELAAAESQKKIGSLEKRSVRALMKRSVQAVVNNKTTKDLKSLSYGLATRQHFIDIASLNIPAQTLVKLYRKLHLFYFPHLKELHDWEVPTAGYMKECSEMIGHAAESCAAHDLAEGVEYCVGMDGSTKDAWHLMTANARVHSAQCCRCRQWWHREECVSARPAICSEGWGHRWHRISKGFLAEYIAGIGEAAR